MKKKLISILLAGTLACSMTACGGSKTEETQDSVAESVQDAEGEATEQIRTESTSTTIYIGTLGGTMEEYPCDSSDNPTPEMVISTMAGLTGWNLDLADKVTVGEGGMTVCFAKTSSLFVGPPEPQNEEFMVFDGEDLTRKILDSIQYTLQHNFVDSELGDPESLDIYFSMEGNQPLELPLIGKTLPIDQPYKGLDVIEE